MFECLSVWVGATCCRTLVVVYSMFLSHLDDALYGLRLGNPCNGYPEKPRNVFLFLALRLFQKLHDSFRVILPRKALYPFKPPRDSRLALFFGGKAAAHVKLHAVRVAFPRIAVQPAVRLCYRKGGRFLVCKDVADRFRHDHDKAPLLMRLLLIQKCAL